MGKSKKDSKADGGKADRTAAVEAHDAKAADDAEVARSREQVEQGEQRPTVDPPEDADELSDAEKVVLESERISIRINVAVNGHQNGDRLVVDRDHPFYSALLSQNLAEIIGDED